MAGTEGESKREVSCERSDGLGNRLIPTEHLSVRMDRSRSPSRI